MSKRDYYEILGRRADRIGHGNQERVPQARAEASPGSQSGRSRGRRTIQGSAPKRTRSSPTPTSAPPTIASAMRASAPRPAPAAASIRRCSPSSATLGDILGNMFGFGDLFGGGGRRRGGPQRGGDLRYDLEITFEESARGTETTIQIPRQETCETCNGSGAAPGTSPTTCSQCRGRVRCAFSRASSPSRARARSAAAPAR